MAQQKYLLKLQSAFWQFQTVTVSECCLIKFFRMFLLEKYIYILALGMASPGNQERARCVGALFVPCRRYLSLVIGLGF